MMDQMKKASIATGITACLGTLLLFTSPAYGQGNTWAGASLARVMESARWKLGIFKVNAALTLINTGYDTDVYYGYLEQAFPDFTFTGAVPLQVFLPVGKTVVLEAFDSPEYLFYADNREERAWNNIFRTQIHFAMNRIYGLAGGGVSNVRQRLSPEVNINVREKRSHINGAFLWQFSEEASIAFLYENASYQYGDSVFAGTDLARSLNRREGFLDFVTYFQPNPRIRLFLNGQFGTFSFNEDTSSSRNARSYGIFGGLAFVPREGEETQISPPQGSISLGFKHFDIRNPVLRDGSDLVGTANVSTGILRRTSIRAVFSRDFTYSAYSIGTYFLSTTYGAGIVRRLSRRAAFTYDFSKSRSAYPGSEDGMMLIPNYGYNVHNVALNIQLARNLEVMFYAVFGRRNQEAPEWSRTRNFFGINIIFGTPTSSVSGPVRGLSL